jgi:hypothetical protein
MDCQKELTFVNDNISLTWEDPLFHAQFLAKFLPAIISLINLQIYGETDGYWIEQLETIVFYLNSVGMNLKFPSMRDKTHWEEDKKFL